MGIGGETSKPPLSRTQRFATGGGYLDVLSFEMGISEINVHTYNNIHSSWIRLAQASICRSARSSENPPSQARASTLACNCNRELAARSDELMYALHKGAYNRKKCARSDRFVSSRSDPRQIRVAAPSRKCGSDWERMGRGNFGVFTFGGC